MEGEFAAAVARWQNFETLAGSIAATLLGLLFVAVSIRPALFSQENHVAFLTVAAKSMGLFMLVALMALVLQIPDIKPDSMGIVLGIMAVISIFNTMQQVAAMRPILNEWGLLFLVRRVLLPALGYAGLLLASVALYNGDVRWLSLLGGTQILFLFTGTYNAWDLLIRLGRDKTG
ncbi:MAG TPA: hypothetical protein VK066_22805 [Chloroflexota bacterium]|nr:hypothetical protein [Chloroflexota bacterium]